MRQDPVQFPVVQDHSRKFHPPAAFDAPDPPELAETLVREKKADLVSFGVLYISNPDLVARIRADGPFNQADPSTFHGGGAAGYSDYPALSSAPAAK